MDREEAINIVRKNIPHLGLGATEMTEALESLIPELRESDDEIHRKWILEYLYDGLRKADEQFKDHFKSAIDWLEKQEQKPISSCDIVPYIDDAIAALQDMWREEKVAFDWDDMHEMIEDVARHFYHKEPKPVEWSEEDERILTGIIERGSVQVPPYTTALREEQIEWLMNRLKSLRPQPHWKPSRAQMSMLLAVINEPNNASSESCHLALAELYGELKKL